MLSLVALGEQLEEALSDVNAIIALAEKEEREFSEEEKTTVDNLTDTVIPDLKAKIDHRKKLDEIKAMRTAEVLGNQLPKPGEFDDSGLPIVPNSGNDGAKAIVVPARAKRTNLVAFRGENAARCSCIWSSILCSCLGT